VIDVSLPVTRTVVARIRALRKSQGISAEKLAELMREAGYAVQSPSIRKAEILGRQEISVDWLVAAATSLGVTPDHLLRGTVCAACADTPPPGFACIECGAKTTR
jgi:transcriptional regulator with XRE-family HTH domain